MTTVLVTGATGTIGSKVAAALSSRPGVRVRAAVHARAPEVAAAERVELDFARPATFGPALRGVDRVFLLTPIFPEQAAAVAALAEAARDAGVQRIVRLSGRGAAPRAAFGIARWHAAAEEALRASGVPWTALRPTHFMDNFVNYYPPDAGGNIYLPWGQGASPFVDARDVADAATEALLEEGHAGAVYELTGPRDLTIAEAARVIGARTGRTVRHVDVPDEAARAAMVAGAFPAWLADAMVEFNQACRAGASAGPADGVRRLLGREPRTFEAFVDAHAARFAAA